MAKKNLNSNEWEQKELEELGVIYIKRNEPENFLTGDTRYEEYILNDGINKDSDEYYISTKYKGHTILLQNKYALKIEKDSKPSTVRRGNSYIEKLKNQIKEKEEEIKKIEEEDRQIIDNLTKELNINKTYGEVSIRQLAVSIRKAEELFKENKLYSERVGKLLNEKKENEEKINNLNNEINVLKYKIGSLNTKLSTAEEAKGKLKRNVRIGVICGIAVLAVLAAGAATGIGLLTKASQSKDSIINDKDQIINDKDEIIENQLQNEDWAEFKNSLEEKLGGKILLYAYDEGMAGSMRVYFEKDGNLCMKSYKLPEGINDFDGFNKLTLEQFKNDINSDKVEVFDEFSFSKTQKREISVDGVTYNLNGMTNAYGLVKYLLPQNEGESDADYIARCNEVLAAVPSLIIEDQYDDNQKLIGKKVILDAFVAESPDEINDAERIQKEKYYSEQEVASMQEDELYENTLKEGDFVEVENAYGYNFLSRLNIVSATNDIKDSINNYTDPQEIKKLNIELQKAGIIKIGESVVSKVAESGCIKYLRITDLAKRDCLYAVKYTNSKPDSDSVEKYISLNNYTTDADARDVLMYSLTGNFFDRFGSEDKTMYVKSSISTISSNEYKGNLDIVCVGYSSDNPIAMEKKGLVVVISNDKLNTQKLVDVVIAKINNDKCPVKGTIEYSLTGAQAIKNEEDLVEIDGQIMTTKALTNSLIDEGLIQYK